MGLRVLRGSGDGREGQRSSGTGAAMLLPRMPEPEALAPDVRTKAHAVYVTAAGRGRSVFTVIRGETLTCSL